MEDLRAEIEELRKEVRELKSVLRAARRGLALPSGESFLQKVQEERDRSERYNHFFALVSFECAQGALQEVLERIRAVVRKVDVVGVIGEETLEDTSSSGNPHSAHAIGRVGTIMPETNRDGARAASARALEVLPDREPRCAIAVYPDDSTDPAELVRMVAR